MFVALQVLLIKSGSPFIALLSQTLLRRSGLVCSAVFESCVSVVGIVAVVEVGCSAEVF